MQKIIIKEGNKLKLKYNNCCNYEEKILIKKYALDKNNLKKQLK